MIILKKGWAILGYQRVLQEMDLILSEAIEFIKLNVNAVVVQHSKTSINLVLSGNQNVWIH